MRHRFHAGLSSGIARRLIPLLAFAGILAACREAEAPLGPTLYASQFNQVSRHGLHGAIAFHSTRDGDVDIYAMNASAKTQTVSCM